MAMNEVYESDENVAWRWLAHMKSWSKNQTSTSTTIWYNYSDDPSTILIMNTPLCVMDVCEVPEVPHFTILLFFVVFVLTDNCGGEYSLVFGHYCIGRHLPRRHIRHDSVTSYRLLCQGITVGLICPLSNPLEKCEDLALFCNNAVFGRWKFFTASIWKWRKSLADGVQANILRIKVVNNTLFDKQPV